MIGLGFHGRLGHVSRFESNLFLLAGARLLLAIIEIEGARHPRWTGDGIGRTATAEPIADAATEGGAGIDGGN